MYMYLIFCYFCLLAMETITKENTVEISVLAVMEMGYSREQVEEAISIYKQSNWFYILYLLICFI